MQWYSLTWILHGSSDGFVLFFFAQDKTIIFKTSVTRPSKI